MADLYEMIMGTVRAGEAGKAESRRRGIAGLMSQAYTAPREQRQELLGQMAGIDSQAAYDAQKHLSGLDDMSRQEMGRYAMAFDALPDEQKPQAYPAFAMQMQKMGLPAPVQWNPEYGPRIRQFAQAWAGGGGENTVQSRFVGQDGQIYALMRDGSVSPLGIKADPNTQIIEGAGGFYGVDKRNLQATPVQIGQPGVQQPQRTPGEVPFTIDPSLPPQVQAAIRADEGAFAGVPDGGQVNIGPSRQLQAAPKQQAPSDIERRIAIAQQMGASPDEVKRMVVGGDSGRDAQRISTADATKARLKLTQIASARQQLAAVKRAFGPLRDSFSAGLGGQFLPTQEGQAFDRAIRNLSPLITAVTRVPGVGAMSDFESKLQEAALPSRGTYEATTEQQIADLERLLDTVEQGYRELLGDGAKPVAPAGNGWSIEVAP